MFPTQTQIDPSLAALLQTAQMVTPDQTPTVAAQIAQAAQQKMQPQGIAQGMPQAKQEFQQAAPSVMRNLQQQQMQQMVQQAMQPKPVGIEGAAGPKPPGPGVAGIPAQNMQRMQQMAEGGVVGFATGDAVSLPEQPQAPDYEEIRKREDERYTAAPTINRIRGIEAQRAAAEKALPDLSAAGIAALQRKRQADEELMAGVRADDPRRRRAAMFEEWGGAKGVYNKQLDTINQRESLANQAALQHEQAVLTLQKAQQERELGRFDRALALEKQAADMEDKARDASLRAQQISAGIASNIYSSQATMRGQDIQAQEAAANRAHQTQLEQYRRQTQLMKPHEQLTIERLEKYKLNELTDGKPNTATPAQQAQALREAIQEARGGARPTDFSTQYDIALKARLARGEPDNAETREAARRDVSPTGRRADLATRQAVRKLADQLLLTREFKNIKDPTEARKRAEEAAARELGVSVEDVQTAPAAPAAGASAPRGTRDNPIKLG